MKCNVNGLRQAGRIRRIGSVEDIYLLIAFVDRDCIMRRDGISYVRRKKFLIIQNTGDKSIEPFFDVEGNKNNTPFSTLHKINVPGNAYGIQLLCLFQRGLAVRFKSNIQVLCRLIPLSWRNPADVRRWVYPFNCLKTGIVFYTVLHVRKPSVLRCASPCYPPVGYTLEREDSFFHQSRRFICHTANVRPDNLSDVFMFSIIKQRPAVERSNAADNGDDNRKPP